MQELYDASSEARDADAVAAVWMGVYNAPFVTLYDRGLLTHLIVVDEVPEAAQAQLDAMAAEVASSTVEPVEEVVAPVVVQIDPVAQCRIDFHEMGSAQFMQKYLNNQKNRPTYEAAIVPRLAMRVSKLKRKRDRQRKRHEQRPQRVAPISPITGEVQATFQIPTHSDLRRCSTASLIREIQRRPESRGLIEAIAESQRS